MAGLNRRSTLWAGFAVALVIVAAMTVLTWRFIDRMQATSAWVVHTHQVQTQLVSLLSTLQDVESNARGYIIGGNDFFLAPFNAALGEVDAVHQDLCRLVSDNPAQQRDCTALASDIAQRVASARAAVQMRQTSSFSATLRSMATGTGPLAMERIRTRVDAMQAREVQVLQARQADAEADTRSVRTTLLAGTAVSIGLLLLVWTLMMRENRLRLAAQAQRDRFFTMSLDVLCMASPDGYFKQINPAFTELLGYSEAEMLAQPFMDLLHPDDLLAAAREVERLAAGHTTVNFEVRFRRRAGGWVLLSWRAQADPNDGLIYASGHDVTELRATTEALRASEENLAVTLHAIGDAVLATDARGRIRQINPVAQALTGWREAEAMGQPVEAVFHIVNEETRAPAFIPVADTLAHGTLHGLANHTVLIARDGVERTIANSCAPIFDRTGEVVGAVLVFRDVTEARRLERDMRRLNQRLEAALANAEQASQAKSDFLATMSHEIRTPMNGVIGMVDVLHQTSLTGSQVEMVDLVRESALSLLDILEDILDFSKIEAGKLEIEAEPMALEDLAEKACSLLDPMARRQQVALQLYVDPALPAQVLGDALRVRQVLLNLVNNAIKFSSGSAHPARVSLRLTQAGAPAPGTQPTQVLFIVSDNGIGMDAAMQARLFSPFSQADASTTRRHGGTGLGLAITRHLVELMGGDISAASAPGQGTVFTVRLPLPIAAVAAAPPREALLLAGLRCLLVGGTSGQSDELGSYLIDAGAWVDQTPDLATAAARPSDAAVWLVMADEEPPAAARLQAARAAATPAHATVPGLIVVANRRAEHGPPYTDADGVTLINGNVLKRDTLLRTVAALAGLRPHEPQADDRPLPRLRAVGAPPSREQALRDGRLILVAEDNETNQEVIRRQLSLLGYAADLARNGREALACWHSHRYALLVTDLHMPELDGYELAAAIRQAEGGGPPMPIVALTANALKAEQQRCLAAGMQGYLSKPAQLAQLRAMLERWMPPAEAGGAAAEPDPAPTAPDPLLDLPVDLRVLDQLLGNDPVATERILGEFKRSAADNAAALLAACDRGDIGQAGAQAHKLKSSAGTLGARRLAALCQDIEQASQAQDITTVTALRPLFAAEWQRVAAYLAAQAPGQ
ncbi:MAG: CHASE3 domain-containing protein [Burkholderiales bacterium]